MTVHEKYNLKTDIKSVKERIQNDVYWTLACNRFTFNGYDDTPDTESDIINRAKAHEFARDVRSADLALLCELAEKGERYEKAVKKHREIEREQAEAFRNPMFTASFFWTHQGAVDTIDRIITEAEGEPR